MMEIRYLPDPVRYKRLDTRDLRENFLAENLFAPGKVNLIYSHPDRTVVGSIVPTKAPLKLECGKEIASQYFTERREVGIINIGGTGIVNMDDRNFTLSNCDFLYIGRGSRDPIFSSQDPQKPAQFYLLSYPAHAVFPTTLVTQSDMEPVHLGSLEESNKRTIYKAIHPGGAKSCQLVMGMTVLAEGCVWNTMSAHTHERRTEVYLYFDIPKDSVVFHFMGMPAETRHIVVRDRQVVLSPSWSIHSGAGTRNYKFIWGMGGENQDFGDMDAVKMEGLY
jgi:4-deoxy-L-threo-5-hexosulose-uronate ketol-isomerase